MSKKVALLAGFFFPLAVFFSAFPAHAGTCGHRLGIGAGLVHTEQPSETNFEIGAEYECRMDPIFGLGGFVNYIFSDPSIAFLGAPEIFVHPLAGEFYVAASPLMETGAGVGTHFGVRFATRLPIPVGFVTLVPSFALDFINGGKVYWFGLGFAL